MAELVRRIRTFVAGGTWPVGRHQRSSLANRLRSETILEGVRHEYGSREASVSLEAETRLEQWSVELPNTENIAPYVANFRDFLKDGSISERKALIRNFVEGIEVVGDEGTPTCAVLIPSDGVMSESASILDSVKPGPP